MLGWGSQPSAVAPPLPPLQGCVCDAPGAEKEVLFSHKEGSGANTSRLQAGLPPKASVGRTVVCP